MTSQIINGAKSDGAASMNNNYHFSRIAHRYRDLRTTDLEPISFIARELSGLPCVEAADVGCGAGRYDLLLHEHLGEKLHLTCVDPNKDMLKTLDTYLKRNGVRKFRAVNSSAESLPFPNDALDGVFSFNSVHHFFLQRFLEESARILRKGGYLFIYTRLQQQNERNIWGRYFPEFCRKESRLHRLNTFVEALIKTPGLRAKSVEHFKYRRISALDRLVEQARANHYSTFGLYPPEELEGAITGFRRNIECYFEDIHRVTWCDENVLFVIRKEE